MKQAIAGVTPPQLGESASMVIFPTIGANGAGRLVGRLCAVGADSERFFTVGKLLAVACIPLALAAFAWNLLPYVMRRYRLTNKRLVVHRGYTLAEERAVDLDGFDQIEIRLMPGQEWLRSGDLVFTCEGKEVFQLSGVGRPEIFREVCLKARTAFVSIRKVMQEQTVSQSY